MFKVGNKVMCMDDSGEYLIDEHAIYTVTDSHDGFICLGGREGWFRQNRFELYTDSNPVDEKESVLEEANRIIYGDREKTYGHPSKNLEVIAKLWSEWVSANRDMEIGVEFSAKDVAVMMILLKTARLANDINHRDSVTDICGYAALIERCDE